jgi:hypothetical protein
MFPALSVSVIASEGHVNSTLGRVARGIGEDLVFLNGMAEAILVKREWLVIDSVARELLDSKTLDDAEVELAIVRIDETLSSQEYSRQLSQYRSIQTPRSRGWRVFMIPILVWLGLYSPVLPDDKSSCRKASCI